MSNGWWNGIIFTTRFGALIGKADDKSWELKASGT